MCDSRHAFAFIKTCLAEQGSGGKEDDFFPFAGFQLRENICCQSHGAAAAAAARANSSSSSPSYDGGGAGKGGSIASDYAAGGGKNPGASTGVSGSSVVSYAMQFVGNPYVWGGTSLTNGADCSGFIMSVYAHFGVHFRIAPVR